MMLKYFSLGLAIAFPSIKAAVCSTLDPECPLGEKAKEQGLSVLLGRRKRSIPSGYESEDADFDQEKFDRIMTNLKTHGCQCSRFFNTYYGDELNLFDGLIGGDHVVDEVDQACLDWYRARRCVEKLAPAVPEHSSCSCTPNYESLFYETSTNGCVTEGYGPCAKDLCAIDDLYTDILIKNLNIFDSLFDGTSSDFVPKLVNDPGMCLKNLHQNPEERVCTGIAPYFFSHPVESQPENRKKREVHAQCDPAIVAELTQVCADGYQEDPSGRCVLDTKTCTCENGDAATGAACQNANSDSVCVWCDDGWHLENSQCVINVCTCVDGVGTVGVGVTSTCIDHGNDWCDSCDAGFTLWGGACWAPGTTGAIFGGLGK